MCAIYEIMKKNVVEAERPQMTIQNAVHALCMLDNQGCTHSEYVIFIAFPRLQWLINCALYYVILSCLIILLSLRMIV